MALWNRHVPRGRRGLVYGYNYWDYYPLNVDKQSLVLAMHMEKLSLHFSRVITSEQNYIARFKKSCLGSYLRIWRSF